MIADAIMTNPFSDADLDASFDVHPVSRATLLHIDVRRFEEDYLPRALDPELLAANDRTTEERLAATRMTASVDDPVPTVVGMLVFGRDPQHFIPGAYIQFRRMGGTEFPGPVLDEARCTGAVLTQLDQLVGKLDSHNRTAVDITSGPIEERRSTHSGVALRRNAQPEPFFDVQPNWVRCVVRARPDEDRATG